MLSLPLLVLPILSYFPPHSDALPTSSTANSTQCRCFPGDACWPTAATWDRLNQTVDGRLVATVPIASVCHNSSFGQYDAAACKALQDVWGAAETHYESSSSVMDFFYSNNSCNPFTPADTGCTLGNYVSFAINATGPEDFQKAITFVKEHNIRLVIRNTGHDYLGKSTGAGALAIWTHYMKDKKIVQYQSASYTGPAAKLGAGVQVLESYEFSHSHGYVNVGGDCPTVGVAGGYTQGGGHGPIASKFGIAADQALEWEVVTGTGQVVIANRENNSDLYWALSGGGGGTYGVVSSLTVKVYPDLMSSAANLTFPYQGVDGDAFWDAVQAWTSNLPNLLGGGCFAQWQISAKDGFGLAPSNCPGLTSQEMRELFRPVLETLEAHNISHKFNPTTFPNFLPSYKAFVAAHGAEGSLQGSRLPLRENLEQNLSAIVDVWRNFVDAGGAVGGTGNNISEQGFPPQNNSIDPVRRKGVYNMIISSPYSNTDYQANVKWANEITEKWMPQLEALTPGARAYLNEADHQQPDWQHVFYGENYGPLLAIKDRYDPDQIFYATTAVGSDRWFADEGRGGRLCPVP